MVSRSGECYACGKWVNRGDRHHIVAKGMGGRKAEGPTVLMCHPCHMWVHANPGQAYESGLLVKRMSQEGRRIIEEWEAEQANN